jgi:metallophosphoesterase (TIGR00282 family)
MKILFFGDIVGRIGREAVVKILPQLKAELQPDVTLANVENIAHGRGITQATLQPVLDAGIEIATSGDHVWDKPEAYLLLQDERVPLIRPANYPAGAVGQGARVFTVGTKRVLVINLVGRVFLAEGVDSPFQVIEKILTEYQHVPVDARIVDFHAEATSEKQAMGWNLDGRVTAVVGTHTHVPTADGRVLTGGTAYLSDLGMCGAYDGVIGFTKEDSLKRFRTAMPAALDIPKDGPAIINAAYIETDDSSGQALSIKNIQRVVNT